MKYFVYAIENIVNGKLYIGVSNNPDRRYKEHLHRLNRAYGCPKLGNALIHYGTNNFCLRTVYCGNKDNCLAMEVYLIKELNTLTEGYNASEGGEGSDRLTPWNKGTVGICKPNTTSFKCGGNIGEKHPRSKLTDADRLSIYERHIQKEKATALALEFGVAESTIHRAVNFIRRSEP